MTKDNQMAIGQYLAAVKKWWWLLVASVLVASVSSYYAVSRAPRIYEATTTVIVGQGLQKANPTYQDFSISQQLAQTYLMMVSRRPILEEAAEALSLSYVPWSGNISARIVPGTQLMEISVRDTSPERARALADEIAQQLILQTPTDSLETRERRDFVQEQLQRLQGNIQATADEIETEQARLDAANSARAIQQYQSNIAALQQKLSAYESSFASLLLTVQGGTNYISVVEPAATPSYPISPQVMETIMLAAAVGLGLAIGGVFLIEFLDDTIKTPDDVTRVSDLTLLGTVSRISDNAINGSLVVKRDPQSLIAESFRALRTNIQFASLDRPIRTLMVTSPDPVEGKSLIIANLAVALAQGGSSVLLVDADMRRPTQHELFGLPNGYGLSSALLELTPNLSEYSRQIQIYDMAEMDPGTGEGQVLRQARPAGAGDLRVMTSGPIPPNPADMLASERMLALIKGLESESDIVLIDAPPVMAVTDPVMLSTRVDGVLIVVDTGHTRRARAKGTVERLSQVGANLLGVVLNRVPPRRGGYYSYGHYDYVPRDGRRSEHLARGATGMGPAGRSSGKSQPATRGPRWWRSLRAAANSAPAPRQTGSSKSLDQWLGEFGGPDDGRREPERRQVPGEPEVGGEEDIKRTQQVVLGDYLSREPDVEGEEDIKRTQQVFLRDHLPPEPDAEGEEDIKRTQQVVLKDHLPPESEVEDEEDNEENRVISLDDHLEAELETESEQKVETDPPVKAT